MSARLELTVTLFTFADKDLESQEQKQAEKTWTYKLGHWDNSREQERKLHELICEAFPGATLT